MRAGDLVEVGLGCLGWALGLGLRLFSLGSVRSITSRGAPPACPRPGVPALSALLEASPLLEASQEEFVFFFSLVTGIFVLQEAQSPEETREEALGPELAAPYFEP